MGGCLWAGLEDTNGMSVAKINGSGSTLNWTRDQRFRPAPGSVFVGL